MGLGAGAPRDRSCCWGLTLGSATATAPALRLLFHKSDTDSRGHTRRAGWATGKRARPRVRTRSAQEQRRNGLSASHGKEGGDPRPTSPSPTPGRPENCGQDDQCVTGNQCRNDPGRYGHWRRHGWRQRLRLRSRDRSNRRSRGNRFGNLSRDRRRNHRLRWRNPLIQGGRFRDRRG